MRSRSWEWFLGMLSEMSPQHDGVILPVICSFLVSSEGAASMCSLDFNLVHVFGSPVWRRRAGHIATNFHNGVAVAKRVPESCGHRHVEAMAFASGGAIGDATGSRGMPRCRSLDLRRTSGINSSRCDVVCGCFPVCALRSTCCSTPVRHALSYAIR